MTVVKFTEDNFDLLVERDESHFLDFKDVQIAPSKLTKTISAFANTAGGEIYVGLSEVENENGRGLFWEGFQNQEAANPIFQVLNELGPLENHFSAEFLTYPKGSGLVLHLDIFKTKDIIVATDGLAYIRRGAQSLPVKGEDAMERLRHAKGVKTFEDEIVNTEHNTVSNSLKILEFLLDAVPTGEPVDWLKKQQLLIDDRPSVAGVLLFADEPQAVLPKRSAIKVLRYQTKQEAERDFLAFDPITIEGPIYDLIYDAVDETKKIIEGIEKAGVNGMEKVIYPQEALHEIVTNAVLHRDYSIPADVQVRIFDNRIEIESPGRLPGHVTPRNITKTQFSRNPKIVRLINKFKNPPNKDVGEGINTAFEAMDKLRLKEPIISEEEASVLVVLRHESLGSPEQLVMDYLKDNDEITNLIGREITGIKSENTMKQVFYKLRERGVLEQHKLEGRKPAWRKPPEGGA
ncbi:ATP-dependent DNA helicase RecG [Rhizobium ruizarguesonis]|nr:ATP-dependent DNA helicase RecG [Rhizobium ruizarguesonis]